MARALADFNDSGEGISTIHETVYENRFGYVGELRKMGAKIELFSPVVRNPKEFYNFNFEDNKPEYKHAARIYGPLIFTMRQLIFRICGLGQRLFSSACGKWGKCGFGVEHLDRGYEDFDRRIKKLGGNIKSK